MNTIKLVKKKKKAPNGSGRQRKMTHIAVPVELAARLVAYRNAYTAYLHRPVTYEQMLTRWIDCVGRIDPNVARLMNDETSTTPPQPTSEVQVPPEVKMSNLAKCQQIVHEYREAKLADLSDSDRSRWTGKWAVHPDGFIFPWMKSKIYDGNYAALDAVAKRALNLSVNNLNGEVAAEAAGFLILDDLK